MALHTHPRPGSIIEYLHSNTPVIAWVQDVQPNRLKVLTAGNREGKLSINRVLPWIGPHHPESFTRQQIQETLRAHQTERATISAGIDPLELWELAQGEMDSAEAEWFAGLLWENPGPDQVAAMGHVLLQTKTHFKFQPPHFIIHPKEKVDALLHQMEMERRTEAFVAAGSQLFHDLLAGREKERLKALEIEENPEMAADLKALLMTMIADPADTEASSLFAKMTKGMPEDPHLPLILAQTWGIVPEHYNFLLDRAGYECTDTWAEPHSPQIETILKRFDRDAAAPRELNLVSIDSPTTRDIDDAYALQRREGGYRLFLALACPVLHWDFGSELDKAVESRVQSLYLPDGTCHMLPEALGTDRYSLVQGESRPALLLTMDLDEEGRLTRILPSVEWVRIIRNATYDEVEQSLAHPETSPHGLGLELAGKLRKRRVEGGAVILEQPDPDILLTGAGADTSVEIKSCPPYPRAQLLVSELMILANSAIAGWAAEEGVPLLYRTQNIAASRKMSGVWTQPEEIFQAIRFLAPTILETDPKPHCSLGARAYAPVSSPLRRYIDFINVAQVVAAVQTGTPRYSREELESRLSYLSSRLEAVGQVQRFRPRYWKLVYFKQQGKHRFWPAVVVDAGGFLVTLSLFEQQILVRAPKSLFGNGAQIGERYCLTLGRIKPLHNEISIITVREEKECEEAQLW
ncbi:MAG: ribonuclease catalytic domain-containing protein [Desulfovibrionales bacterium]